MKRKLLITFVVAFVFALLLAISSYAAINYNEKAVLADGTTLPIYDENQNPLIWYISGVDENGKNIYSSVPNNRNEPTKDNDSYVTYTINTSWMTQLQDVNFHIYNGSGYDTVNDKTYNVVVLNLRGLTNFQYINKGLGVSSIQYIYFNEGLKDFCDYFQNSQNLRLVDLSECSDLSGGFGGVCNLQNCINLHTVRLAPGTAYTLKCNSNRNYRFKNTAITEIIIPENIINLGVDNFNGCKNLESIYILGNTTSLGQRNFAGCTSLTNIYILGNNPTIDLTSFKENFYECVDNGKVLDFKSTGKYFFFVTTNTEYLNGVKDAIGATEIISYNDYKASPDKYTEGRYIISGTNICDTLYNGVHAFDESANDCAGLCSACKEIAQKQNQAHSFTSSIKYTNYLASGVRYQICSNDNCQYSENPYISDTDAIISEFKGISTKINGDGITFGYSVNYEALDEYVNVSGGNVELGFIVAVKAFLGDKLPLDEKGNALASNVIKASLLKWTQNDKENKSIVKFANADFKVTGDWSKFVDLDGDGVFETDIKNVALYMSGYIIDNGTVQYLNFDKSASAPMMVSYNDCL